jgi:hypothetical protein
LSVSRDENFHSFEHSLAKTTLEMNELLKEVKDINQEACVSIILNTNRSKPDNLNDPIALKNLVKHAVDRLHNDYDKHFVAPIIENINKVVESIDHLYNLDSLIIFANNNFAKYTRLSTKVEDRVVIDATFSTRDLVRSMNKESAYYILVINQDHARLIEANNDQVVEENKGVFPISNHLSNHRGQDSLIEEFFNQVDKKFLETTHDNPLSVLLATEARNATYYHKVADHKDSIIGEIHGNFRDTTAQEIVSEAWKMVSVWNKKNNLAQISALQQAVSEGKYVSDYNEIWSAIKEGRGQTLFVKTGFAQAAILKDNQLHLVSDDKRDDAGIIDDVIDEMVEQNLAFGGSTVFVEGEELADFQNIALLTRY